ncbi:hypothetical protein [Streptomyces sp. XY332]|uniref:hypothetical protein n=1 Tax=Streptomyces sp. XY332 TaxID=1415561 RepID=UPI0006B2059D|nr:hypothetical protein [Streptomyces sp. XY332]KOY56124.1 hypothetical protein ADK59_20945 [Streptomyces sp. XY332]
MPIPLADTGAPGVPDTLSPYVPEASPVFVDSSGRRQRRVRRMGRLLVIPAAAYVVLLISTVMGGPTVRSPFLPSAQAPQSPKAKDPAAGSTPSPSVGKAANGTRSPQPSGATATVPSSAISGSPAAAGPTAAPVGSPTASSGGARPSPGGGARGRSTSAPGQGGKPTAHP